MQRMFILFAFIFAMLGTTLHSAEAAHAMTVGEADAVHAMHSHDAVGEEAGSEPKGSDQDDQDENSLVHHHCPNAWVGDQSAQINAIARDAAPMTDVQYVPLSSRICDPLLEPPSA